MAGCLRPPAHQSVSSSRASPATTRSPTRFPFPPPCCGLRCVLRDVYFLTSSVEMRTTRSVRGPTPLPDLTACGPGCRRPAWRLQSCVSPERQYTRYCATARPGMHPSCCSVDTLAGPWVRQRGSPSLPQNESFVTTDVCYAHVWKCRPRVWPFTGEFCVTYARRSVCSHLEP